MSDIIVGKQPVDFDADDYNRYVKYFLDTEVGGIVFNLTKDEQDSFFDMCYRYPVILDKVFLLPGDPLMNYIMYGNEFYDALKNPHDGIDFSPSYIVAQYREWAKSRNIPEPVDQVAAEGIDTTPMLEFQKQL
jgi:hypothetical protein